MIGGSRKKKITLSRVGKTHNSKREFDSLSSKLLSREEKLPKIIRNKQHRGELVSASEEAVGRIQAVLFGSSIPETARMDINCATNDAVAAGERIPHCARTAIGTVVAMAGTHAM